MEKMLAKESQWRWTMTVDGRNCGAWKEADGGDKDSEEAKVTPAAGEAEVSLGGKSTYDNLTLTAPYDLLFHADLEPFLDARTGKGKVVAVRQALDRDNVAYGRPRTYTGTLKKLVSPKADADGSDASTIAVEVTVVAAI
jgi:hypothetical protein